MNGKSVRMSPAKTSCISTRLWKEADRDRQRRMRPPGELNVVEQLALRRLGPAGAAAVRRITRRPERTAGGLAELVGRPAAAGGRLGDLVSAHLEPGQRVTSSRGSRHVQAEGAVGVIRPRLPRVIGAPGRPPDRPERAMLARPWPPGAARCAAAGPGTTTVPSSRRTSAAIR